jgi:hypothetical protein
MINTRSATIRDEKEIRDFVDGLIGDSWKTLAMASYKLAIKNGASHEKAMQKVYTTLLKIAIEVLPE